jgi:hypothetical protein
MRFTFRFKADFKLEGDSVIEAPDIEEAHATILKQLIAETWQQVEAVVPSVQLKYCADCNIDFTSAGAFKRHRARIHGISVTEQGDSGILNMQVFIKWARDVYDRSGSFNNIDVVEKFSVTNPQASSFLMRNIRNKPQEDEYQQGYTEFHEMFDEKEDLSRKGRIKFVAKPKMFKPTDKGAATV